MACRARRRAAAIRAAVRADAEDVLQNACVRLWRSPASGARSSEGSRSAHAYACVRTAALDYLRSSRRRLRREQSLATQAPALFSSPAGIEQEEFRSAVEFALRQLSREQREIVVMKIWGELTFEQIGTALEISPHTAASRYRGACEVLRRLLAREVVP